MFPSGTRFGVIYTTTLNDRYYTIKYENIGVIFFYPLLVGYEHMVHVIIKYDGYLSSRFEPETFF